MQLGTAGQPGNGFKATMPSFGYFDGHTDSSMLNRIYAHVDQNVEHLKKALVA